MNKKIGKNKGRFFGTWTGLFVFVVVALVITFNMPRPTLEVVEDPETGEMTWHVVMKVSCVSAAENDPTGNSSGWLAEFCLDYAETPATCLASNGTAGNYDTWGNVSGYVSTDDTDVDLKSEDPFYFVSRCRFNQTHAASGGVFDKNRTQVKLTVSGDETINDVAGTIVESYNVSGKPYIYINYYWDDLVDGYEIQDDGHLYWNITILAKY